jgi:hypothetical protein
MDQMLNSDDDDLIENDDYEQVSDLLRFTVNQLSNSDKWICDQIEWNASKKVTINSKLLWIRHQNKKSITKFQSD